MAQAQRPPRRVLLRIAGAVTQLFCAACLLLGTIAFVLVQQNRLDGSSVVIGWAAAALVGLVFGVLMGRGGLISLVIAAVLDATFGIVLLALEYDALRALVKVLPESDVQMVADVVTGLGAAGLIAFGLCLVAVPQALRYTRWMHAETQPRLASATARGWAPPPMPGTARGSVWQMPIVAPDESRSRRRLYFALAGFAIGFGAGIGVLASSSASSQRGGGAVAKPVAGPDVSGKPADAGGGSAGGGSQAGAGSGSGSQAVAGAAAGAGSGGAGATQPEAPAGQGEAASVFVAAQRAAIAKGDLAALGAMLAPGVFGFGVDADEVAEGKDAVELQLRKDLGDLVQSGANVEVRYSNIGEERDHAWIAFELEVSARGRSTRRFAVSELAARVGGAWTIVAWHWAIPVLDKTAERMAALGTKPSPKPVSSGLTGGPKELEDAARTALGSRRAFAAARSEHEKGFNFGSGPSERTRGGEKVKKVFSGISAKIRLRDGLRVVGAGAWDPAQKDAPSFAFAAANVDYTTKTKAATDLTHTFRVLAVLIREDGAWKIIQTQWSHGGPVR